MKKGLLIASLIMLFGNLGILAMQDESLTYYASLIGMAGFGTFLVGIIYPKH